MLGRFFRADGSAKTARLTESQKNVTPLDVKTEEALRDMYRGVVDLAGTRISKASEDAFIRGIDTLARAENRTQKEIADEMLAQHSAEPGINLLAMTLLEMDPATDKRAREYYKDVLSRSKVPCDPVIAQNGIDHFVLSIRASATNRNMTPAQVLEETISINSEPSMAEGPA